MARKAISQMTLITAALAILLAGSTDAFAKPRARVARGGASSSKARDAVLLNWLLANSSLSAEETSYYRKYGLGRNGGPRAFGVARNIWIYTKEFMMPKKL